MKRSFLITTLAFQVLLGQFAQTTPAQRPPSGTQPQPKSPQAQQQPPARQSEDETVRITTNLVQELGSQMQPGEYVLQVVVTDLLRRDKYRVTSQWIDFEVIK